MERTRSKNSTSSFAEMRRYIKAHSSLTEKLREELLYELRLLEDSTDQKVRKLKRLDGPTRLYNKIWFEQNILPKFVYSAAREKRNMDKRRSEVAALWYMDCNNFKFINDFISHQVGDLVILKFAEILKQTVRSAESYLGRLGGDEFGVLQFNLKRPSDALLVAGRFQDSFNGYDWKSVDPRFEVIKVTVAIGLVVLQIKTIRGHENEADSICKQWHQMAELEMKFAKAERQDNIQAAAAEYVDGLLVKAPIKGGVVQELAIEAGGDEYEV